VDSGYLDGETDDTTYLYTGEGGSGDMKLNRGNNAIVNHKVDGRELHLFRKIQSGIYEYIGKYYYETHNSIEGIDRENHLRKIIQFTLKREVDIST